MTHPTDTALVTSIEQLHSINGEALPTTQAKILSRLESHSKDFISRSPFLIMATSADGCAIGGADASPRGDAQGFVKVLDDTTILIPERPGNRIADSLRNVISNPGLGLIFMIPGMNETLRINGHGFVTNEARYLEMLTITFANGRVSKAPKLALIVDIKEVYFHCAKAFIRSKLWDPSQHMERSLMPTLGKILLDQIKGQNVTDEELELVDASLSEDSKTNLYHQ